MTEKQFISPYRICDSVAEMDSVDAVLLTEARLAAKNVCSPYSHFGAGTAMLLDNSVIVRISNIENAACPSGLRNERNALFAAQANCHQNKPLAIAAFPEMGEMSHPISSCEDFRHAMAKAEQRCGHKIRIMTQGQKGEIMLFDGTESLLPYCLKTFINDNGTTCQRMV